ncbi:MAG: RNHCP domain-containing protein [Rickettsiales bacterium]|jgi:rubrerythrin|nr:RNHCP domain-containing protein [Rickettsiales bacterium]
MPKKFARRTEDFACTNCGAHVVGDGYTNHCPACLCSLHVDVNPGDRAAACRGLMRPVAIELKQGVPVLVHRCEKCGFTRKNRAAPNDDYAEILKVMKNES